MKKRLTANDIIEDIRIAIKNERKSLLHSSLAAWFKLLDKNLNDMSISQNDDSKIILEYNRFINYLILYAIKEKYEVFFKRVDSTLVHRINESLLIEKYENVSYVVIDYLENELRIDISKDFEKKYFDFTKMLATARINEMLYYLAEKGKCVKVISWKSFEAFTTYFLHDYEELFNLFDAIKKRRGQPIKYNREDHAKLDELIAQGYRRNIAAEKVLHEKGIPKKKIPSFLRIHREMLPENVIAKIRNHKKGN